MSQINDLSIQFDNDVEGSIRNTEARDLTQDPSQSSIPNWNPNPPYSVQNNSVQNPSLSSYTMPNHSVNPSMDQPLNYPSQDPRFMNNFTPQNPQLLTQNFTQPEPSVQNFQENNLQMSQYANSTKGQDENPYSKYLLEQQNKVDKGNS